MEVSDQLHAPSALHPVPTELEPGWAPEPMWTRQRKEISLTLYIKHFLFSLLGCLFKDTVICRGFIVSDAKWLSDNNL